MKFLIKNFLQETPVEVYDLVDDDERLVVLSQAGGSMFFRHAMTPEQARFLAAALQSAADEADAK